MSSPAPSPAPAPATQLAPAGWTADELVRVDPGGSDNSICLWCSLPFRPDDVRIVRRFVPKLSTWTSANTWYGQTGGRGDALAIEGAYHPQCAFQYAGSACSAKCRTCGDAPKGRLLVTKMAMPASELDGRLKDYGTSDNPSAPLCVEAKVIKRSQAEGDAGKYSDKQSPRIGRMFTCFDCASKFMNSYAEMLRDLLGPAQQKADVAWAPRYALSIFSRAAGMSEHGKPTLPPAGPDKEAFLACFRLGGDHVRAVAAHTALQSRIAGAGTAKAAAGAAAAVAGAKRRSAGDRERDVCGGPSKLPKG